MDGKEVDTFVVGHARLAAGLEQPLLQLGPHLRVRPMALCQATLACKLSSPASTSLQRLLEPLTTFSLAAFVLHVRMMRMHMDIDS